MTERRLSLSPSSSLFPVASCIDFPSKHIRGISNILSVSMSNHPRWWAVKSCSRSSVLKCLQRSMETNSRDVKWMPAVSRERSWRKFSKIHHPLPRPVRILAVFPKQTRRVKRYSRHNIDTWSILELEIAASSLSKLRSIRFVYFNVCVLLISTCAKLSYKGKSSPLPFHWNIFCFSDGYTGAYIRFGYWSRCYCSSEQRIVNWKIIPARFSVTISRSLEIALHFDQGIDQGERERKKNHETIKNRSWTKKRRKTLERSTTNAWWIQPTDIKKISLFLFIF